MTKRNRSTTDDINPRSFRPHGRVTFTVDGDVLICDALGPFNKELIDAIEAIEIKLIEELQINGKWGEIIIISGSALASADALAAFAAYLKTLVSNKLISSVSTLVINDSVEGAAIMTPHLVQAYSDAGSKLTVFETVNEAKVWVKLHL